MKEKSEKNYSKKEAGTTGRADEEMGGQIVCTNDGKLDIDKCIGR